MGMDITSCKSHWEIMTVPLRRISNSQTAFLDYDATICRLLLDLGADPMYQTNNGW